MLRIKMFNIRFCIFYLFPICNFKFDLVVLIPEIVMLTLKLIFNKRLTFLTGTYIICMEKFGGVIHCREPQGMVAGRPPLLL